MRPDRDRNRLVRHGRVRFVADLVLLVAALVVVELVGQDRLVVVAVGVEGADGVGVVGPTFVTGDVAHDRPRVAAVEGLVEAEQVVVPLRPREPLARADDVTGIGRVDADVGLRPVGDEHGRGRRVARPASNLRRVGGRPDVLARGRARAGRLAGVAVVRPVVERRWDLGTVAAHLPAGHEHVRHLVTQVAAGVGGVRLEALRHVADAGVQARRRGGESLGGRQREQRDRRGHESVLDPAHLHPSDPARYRTGLT